jgi:uncharacterized protein with HEPN domain
MQLRTRKLLEDISDASAFITEQTQGSSLESYLANRLLRQAVERNFEIIGEAVNPLRRSDAAVAARITDADRIIAFRNVLIHGYHLIDDAEVWQVVVASLPTLAREIEAIIASAQGQPSSGS